MRNIDKDFTYHPPKEGQPARYEEIRDMGKRLAVAIISNCPQSKEMEIALERINEAVMWANASIARNE